MALGVFYPIRRERKPDISRSEPLNPAIEMSQKLLVNESKRKLALVYSFINQRPKIPFTPSPYEK
jgi:hypothetical protein